MERLSLNDVAERCGVEDAARTLQRNNVAQLAAFAFVRGAGGADAGKRFVAVNTHLFWNPACAGENDWDAVRCICLYEWQSECSTLKCNAGNYSDLHSDADDIIESHRRYIQ